MSRGFRLAKVLLGVLVLAALSACGGGGGGSSGASTGSASTGSSVPKTPGLSVSFNPTVLNVSADASVSSAPTATITLTLNQLPASGVQIGGGYTGESISDVSVEQTSDTTADLTISFDDPSVIGPGTYDSTLTVTVCPDTSCTTQATGSPATIPVHYTVTGVKRPNPGLVLSNTTIAAGALAFSNNSPTSTLPFAITNGTGSNTNVIETHTSSAISSVYLSSSITDSSGVFTVIFKSGLELGPGVYNDTITLHASCGSATCKGVDNATQVVAVRYTVTNTVAGPEGFSVRYVNATINDLTWNESRGKIYFTSPSDAPAFGNSVGVLDPSSGTVETSSFVGSEPDTIAASEDGQYLYVALSGATSIRRKTLPDLTQDILIPLANDPTGGSMFANDIEIAPGLPHTIAVARRTSDTFNRPAAGVVIFDDATPRTAIASGYSISPPINFIQWAGNASSLYGNTGYNAAFAVSDITADANGAHLVSSQPNVVSVFSLGRLHFNGGLLYSDNGEVYDPITQTKPGTYTTPSGVFSRATTPDIAHNRFFMLVYAGDGVQLRAYNLATFTLISSAALDIPLFLKSQPRLVRWGTDGLAFATGDGRIVLINGPFVSNVAQ